MSDLAALEILASINRLASEIKSINPPVEVPWYKTYIALISGVVGITLAFLYNIIKELISNKKKKGDYKACIVDEMLLTKKQLIKFISTSCHILDKIKQGKPVDYHTHAPEITSVCYDKFFPEVILEFSPLTRRKLMQLYSSVKAVNSRLIYLKSLYYKSQSTDFEDAALDLLIATCACYSHLKDIESNYEGDDTFDVVDITKELNIELNYFNGLDESEKEEILSGKDM